MKAGSGMDRRKFMLSAGASLAVPGLTDAARAAALQKPGSSLTTGRKPHRPNVIVMICDDLGYGDLGCYGSKMATKNIDRLAQEGVRFTHHSTPHPVCSAARAALLTGMYPTRVNSTGAFVPLDTEGMSTDCVTTADLLRGVGYRTMAIGKWHLGHAEPYWPTNRGFDDFYGVPYSVDMAPLPLMQNKKILEEDADRDELSRKYTDAAVSFLEKPHDKPFFLYLAYSYPHIPLHASRKFRGRSPFGAYGDALEEIDASVGEILHTLKQKGLAKDTLVIFTSDHGPWYQGSTGELRERKGSTYEGGVRVPMIASMPGVLPEGKVADAVTSHMDLLPTLAGLCDAKLPERSLDGVDAWEAFVSGRLSRERKPLLGFSGWNPQTARLGKWKLHVSRPNLPSYLPVPKEGRMNCALQRPELYDLIADPKESYDVAERNPDVVDLLKKSIEEQVKTLPEKVQQAYAISHEHPSNAWMPAGAYPEFVSTKPGTSVWRVGADADVVLQRFRSLATETP